MSASFCRAIVLIASLTTLAGPPLTLYYEDRPPLSYRDGDRIAGLVGQPVAEAVAQAGVAVDYQLAPFQRHMTLIERNLVAACAVGRFKNAQREALGKFSAPIYRDGKFIALMRRDSELENTPQLSQLLMRPGVRVLLKTGYSYGPNLDALLLRIKPVLIHTSDESIGMARMLAAGMADLMFASQEEALALNQDGRLDQKLIPRHFADMPPGELRYLYCSRQVGDRLLARINAKLPATP